MYIVLKRTNTLYRLNHKITVQMTFNEKRMRFLSLESERHKPAQIGLVKKTYSKPSNHITFLKPSSTTR